MFPQFYVLLGYILQANLKLSPMLMWVNWMTSIHRWYCNNQASLYPVQNESIDHVLRCYNNVELLQKFLKISCNFCSVPVVDHSLRSTVLDQTTSMSSPNYCSILTTGPCYSIWISCVFILESY